MFVRKKFLKNTVVALTICLSSFCITHTGLYAAEDSATQTVLYDQGMELVDLISEMASSDAYTSMSFPQGEIHDLVSSIGAQDHSAPVSVSQVQIDYDITLQQMAGDVISQLPEKLLNHLKKRVISSIPSMINARQNSSTAIAASSLCSTGKTFVADGLNDSIGYLYIFEAAAPVFVTFVPGDDHSVSANASFIILDEKASPVDAEAVESLFQETGIPVQFSEISLPAEE